VLSADDKLSEHDQILGSLSERLSVVERTRNDARSFSWSDLDDDEKWRVTWGVAWRGLVVYVGIIIVVALLALVLGR
jgi:hypothetical protein